MNMMICLLLAIQLLMQFPDLIYLLMLALCYGVCYNTRWINKIYVSVDFLNVLECYVGSVTIDSLW